MRSVVLICSVGFVVLLVNSGNWLADQLVLRGDDSFLQNSLSFLINRELSDKQIPGLAISVVHDQNILFEQGFGFANPEKDAPASPYTVFQAGTVAQLFTTIAILQRVEHNKLNLDSPISQYLPTFAPDNPWGLDLTLRQILSHQSGMVTEPPVGHYYDSSETDLTEIVQSINHTGIVFPPETFTKFSNAGYAVAGLVLQESLEKPFEQHMRAILDRMHLKRTSFAPRIDLRTKLAQGHTSTLDDRVIPVKEFEIANGPANNLYTTVNDLGAFLRVLFADGLSPNGVILSAESFEQMWTIQMSTARKEIPFGLGFAVSIFEGERRATLTSNTHGFSTRIDLLPDRDIGVAVIANLEDAAAVLEKVSSYALRAALAQHLELPTPPFPNSIQPDSAMVSRTIGYYVNESPLYISRANHNLYLYQDFQRHRLRQIGDSLIIDDLHTYGPILISDGLTLEFNNLLYSKRNNAVPAPGNPKFLEYTGVYGNPNHPYTFVENNDMLYVLDGWSHTYALTSDSIDQFTLPVDEMFGGEYVTFERDENDQIVSVVFANMPLDKLRESTYSTAFASLALTQPIGDISSTLPMPESMSNVAGTKPNEMVDLALVDPLINLDVRYATENNLLSTKIYSESRALLQQPVAEAVFRIQRHIRNMGYELVIYDTYQPWYISQLIWSSVPDSLKFFFNDPQQDICQNNGTAVSLSLFQFNAGEPVPMPTGYDVLTPHAHADSPLPEMNLRWNRDFLRRLMEAEGFTVDAKKWWHFTHKSCDQYPVMNTPLAEVEYISPSNLQRIFTVDR